MKENHGKTSRKKRYAQLIIVVNLVEKMKRSKLFKLLRKTGGKWQEPFLNFSQTRVLSPSPGEETTSFSRSQISLTRVIYISDLICLYSYAGKKNDSCCTLLPSLSLFLLSTSTSTDLLFRQSLSRNFILVTSKQPPALLQPRIDETCDGASS